MGVSTVDMQLIAGVHQVQLSLGRVGRRWSPDSGVDRPVKLVRVAPLSALAIALVRMAEVRHCQSAR